MAIRFMAARSTPLSLASVLTSTILRALEPVLHPRRFRAKKLIRLNQEFLARLNFKQIEDGDLSYIDGDGNSLRRVQTNNNQITFIVVGSRRRRAYIALDKKGRYVSYTGPIRI